MSAVMECNGSVLGSGRCNGAVMGARTPRLSERQRTQLYTVQYNFIEHPKKYHNFSRSLMSLFPLQ